MIRDSFVKHASITSRHFCIFNPFPALKRHMKLVRQIKEIDTNYKVGIAIQNCDINLAAQ